MRHVIAFAAATTAAALLSVACGLDVSGDGPPEDALDSGTAPDANGEASPPDVNAADVPVAVDSAGGDGSSAGDAEGATDAGDAPDARPAVAPPDLAWYKLDETSGDVAHDSTANGYDVTLHDVTWSMGANFALPDGGAASGGSTAVSAGLRQAPVSFTAWLAPAARSDETSNAYGITPFPPNAVSGDLPGSFGFGIGLNTWTDGTPGSALAVENVGYAFSNAGGSAFVAGTEYFVAAAIDTTSASLYVDGQLVAKGAVNMPLPAPTATLRLGFHNEDTGYGTRRFYVGRMRDVRVYKSVLTAGDVASLYADGPAP